MASNSLLMVNLPRNLVVRFSELSNQIPDREFSQGLSYYEVMDLAEENLDMFLKQTPREEIIDWLQWNDPNGAYTDNASLTEFGNILTKEDGVEIMKRQVFGS